MTFDEINQILGEPTRILTSGLLIYEYSINNKTYKVQYINGANGSNVSIAIQCFDEGGE